MAGEKKGACSCKVNSERLFALLVFVILVCIRGIRGGTVMKLIDLGHQWHLINEQMVNRSS